MSQSKLQEHWRKPKNTKSLVDADGIGRASNPVYGDTLELCIKVKGDTIMDASFKALGCKEAVAVCSFVTEMIKSKPLSLVSRISAREIADQFELPPERMHCAILVEQVLKRAIEDYREKQGER